MKNDGKYSEDEIKNTYRSLLNNSDLNENKWIVKMSSFQNDCLELELDDMFNKSISVKNRTYLMYVIQDEGDSLTVNLLKHKSNESMNISNAEDKSNETMHESHAEDKSNEMIYESKAEDKSNESMDKSKTQDKSNGEMHINNGDMGFILKIIGIIIFTISILICGFLCYAFVFQPNC
jgi:Fe2+ transport system protein B